MYILYKVSLGHKNGYVALVHRLPNQTNYEFENFLENCENMLNQTWSTNTLFRAIPGILMLCPLHGRLVIKLRVKETNKNLLQAFVDIKADITSNAYTSSDFLT